MTKGRQGPSGAERSEAERPGAERPGAERSGAERSGAAPAANTPLLLLGWRNGRTQRVLWTLEEAGARYAYREVDPRGGVLASSAFRALNPAGKLPVLCDGQFAIAESLAICLHLAERFPGARLLPPPASRERARCMRWLAWLVNEIDPLLWTVARHRFVLPRERRVPQVEPTVAWELAQAWPLLARALDEAPEGAAGAGPWIAGAEFTLADVFAGHLLGWADSARLPVQGEAAVPLARYRERLAARPAHAAAAARAAAPDGTADAAWLAGCGVTGPA